MNTFASRRSNQKRNKQRKIAKNRRKYLPNNPESDKTYRKKLRVLERQRGENGFSSM
jgi:hypothetical protein